MDNLHDQKSTHIWAPGTANMINEWARDNLGFDLEQWQLDLLRQFEAPPAPRTMDEIEWDDEEHHLAEASAAVEGLDGHITVIMLGTNTFGHVRTLDPTTREMSSLSPDRLTPTGRKYRLEPEDDTPTANPEPKNEAPPLGIDFQVIPSTWHEDEPAAPRPEDVPEFDPAYTYTDRAGDKWSYVAGGWRWGGYVISRPHSAPPAEYGPYTRVDEEADR